MWTYGDGVDKILEKSLVNIFPRCVWGKVVGNRSRFADGIFKLKNIATCKIENVIKNPQDKSFQREKDPVSKQLLSENLKKSTVYYYK